MPQALHDGRRYMAATDPRGAGAPSSTSAVFSQLLNAPQPMTKQEVAQAVGVSLPTVYQAFNALDERGLLTAGEERTSTGGRRAATFGITHEGFGAIGIAVTGTELRAAVCNLQGERYSGLVRDIAVGSPSSSAQLNAHLRALVEELCADTQARGIQIVGTGIGVPSAIDPATGRLVNTKVMRLTDAYAYARDLTAGIAGPVGVFNDADCGAFSQFCPGGGEGYTPAGCPIEGIGRTMAYLSLERGVGGSILIDGTPIHGTRNLSGEFGHICVETDGRPCTCGQHGCLEAYCSTAVLSDEQNCTLEEFFSRIAEHDSQAAAALDAYLEHLARGIHAIRMVLDCPVVIGGIMSYYLQPFIERLNERVRELDPFALANEQLALTSSHPFHGVAFGAALQMVERYTAGL